MLKSYLLILFLFFTSQFYEEVAAQTNFTVEGRILDLKTEEPISGVSIRVKESIKSSSVMTGSQGSFRIRLHQGQTLVISHLNYTPQEIQVRSGQSNLVIRLAEDPHMLSEVNVTGALGIKRQARELGTSAQSVDNQELNLGKVVNPLLALSSKVAGLRINATDLTTGKTDPGIQIRLRGTRSLNRSKNDPI
ncbi:MAG: carboxypeptidase-like regulatory domain-containing protein, partial [Sphingobacterium siyangense]